MALNNRGGFYVCALSTHSFVPYFLYSKNLPNLVMADFTRGSSKHGDVEMANRNGHYNAVGSKFSSVIFHFFYLLETFLTSKSDFLQNENEGYLADPGENAGNKPGWKGNQDEEDFDPWALPELQDLGPKWSGKYRVWLYFSSNFVILQKFRK